MILPGGPDPAVVAALLGAIRRALAERDDRPLVVGICGAQGSGKSTLATALAQALAAEGTASAVLSLDDFYLTRADRAALAREVHPLFATRGVPGTHDVALGLATLDALAQGEAAMLPRFDKARDDRLPQAEWDRAPADTQVLLFEGWCLGARPQSDDALALPVNALEAQEDPDGIWRRHANAALAGPYAALFARIGLLVLLAAPGFEVVQGWRGQQEAELRARTGPDRSGVMSEAEVERFIQHYERLTRHILNEMPQRADVIARLGPDRSLAELTLRR